MSPLQEQLVALGAVFEAAVLADKIARTGQVSEASMGCMLGSLLVRDPKSTLDVYGGDDLNLRDGYRALISSLERNPSALQREPLRYALAMIGLERQLAKREDMLAPVVYHHSLGIQGAGVPKKESLDEVRILQGHWSNVDPFCPATKRNKLIQELGDRVEAYTYNMPHGFRSVSRGLPEAKVVWQRTVEFFDRELNQNIV